MANTPQSKKRTRQNWRRSVVNKARRSRIRTFLRRVEKALESGDKKEAAEQPQKLSEVVLVSVPIFTTFLYLTTEEKLFWLQKTTEKCRQNKYFL